MNKAFPTVFKKIDRKRRSILLPNLSVGFSHICAAILKRAGYTCITLPPADDNAKRLGKQYLHNDICYPAQINVGECLAYLTKHCEESSELAVAVAKNCRDCRAGQYASLARKALDDAGFESVPVVTTGSDTKAMHPGFRLSLSTVLRFIRGISVLDAMERMRLALRPYEIHRGETDGIFDAGIRKITEVLEKRPSFLIQELKSIIRSFNEIPLYARDNRPRVLICGEILMNYHETANMHIVRYFEENGMEVILPDIVAFFEREIIQAKESVKSRLCRHPILEIAAAYVKSLAFKNIAKEVDQVMKEFKFYSPPHTIYKLSANANGYIELTHAIGEGWLIWAEVIEYARQGVENFVIIQPFGCLPNQVTGKAVIPTIKRLFPNIQIISIDYDADVSMANIENRLQMLIMASKKHGESHPVFIPAKLVS
jgi:predicted nucleotide-binding protein (sugar kinase/HSP70/actin superfamily)